MDNTCSQVRSVKKKEKHKNCSKEVHNGKYGNYNMNLLMPETVLRDSSTPRDLYAFVLLRFDTVKSSMCIVSFLLVL